MGDGNVAIMQANKFVNDALVAFAKVEGFVKLISQKVLHSL